MNHHFAPLILSSLLLFPATNSFAASEVPERANLPKESLWQLNHIYPTDSAWEQELTKIPAKIQAVQSFKVNLGASTETILQCLKARDDLNQNLSKIYAYARMYLDTDQTNGQYQTMQGKAQSILGDASAATSFIEPELLSLPDGILQKYSTDPALKEYQVYFKELARQKAHTLSPEGEISFYSK